MVSLYKSLEVKNPTQEEVTASTEAMLGMPLDEFDKLSFEEQKKVIGKIPPGRRRVASIRSINEQYDRYYKLQE